MSTAYINAWKACDGLADANGGTLRVDRIFMQDELTGLVAADSSANGVNGAYSASGVTLGVTDAKNMHPATSGVLASYNGGALDCGVMAATVDAIDAEGMFFAGWLSTVNRATPRVHQLSSMASGGTNGFTVEWNANQLDQNQADDVAYIVYDAAGWQRGAAWRRTDQLFSDGLPHFVWGYMRLRVGAAAQAGDFVLSYDNTDQGAPVVADYPGFPAAAVTGGGKMGINAYTTGGSVAPSGVSKNSGWVLGRGKPTQAMIDSVMRAGCYTYRGIPLPCKFHLRAGAANLSATTGGTPAANPVANFGSIARAVDQSPFGNDPVNAAAGNRPSRTIDDDGAEEIDADGYYQATAFGVDQRVQSLSVAAASGFNPGHMWMIAAVRLSTSALYQVGTQKIMQLLSGGAQLAALGVPSVGASGADEVAYLKDVGATVYAATGSTFPRARCVSLAVFGVSRGEGGNPSALRVYMNRFASAGAPVPVDSVVTSDGINLFGLGNGEMMAGRFREGAIGMGYLSPAAFLTAAQAIMSEYGYTMNPGVHVRDYSDSTFTQKSTYNRGALMRFPAAIRKRISVCQASIGNQRVKHSVAGDAGVTDVYTDRSPDSAKWGDTDTAGGVATGAAMDIGMLRAGRNDGQADGENAATISAEADLVLAKMLTGGCTKRVISSIQNEYSDSAAYAALCAAKVGVNVDRAVILRSLTGLYASDGFHLSDAGEEQVKDDLLGQGLVPLSPAVFGVSRGGWMRATRDWRERAWGFR